MRLLNTRSLKLEELNENDFIAYAILSHTWESEEVSYLELHHDPVKASSKAGYSKIISSCRQAFEDGWQYIWIDTCCIDKSSSTELTEAINCKLD
jgi:Heterokaryon incompatibility protein (HET)